MPRLYTQKHRFPKQKDKYAYKISLFLSDKIKKKSTCYIFPTARKDDQIIFSAF